MEIKKCYVGRVRHADNFENGEIVFEGEGIVISVFQWNDKRCTFSVNVLGQHITNTSNLPKAIGIGVVSLARKRGMV